jgi:methylthioribose-1-phosphate isomerase
MYVAQPIEWTDRGVVMLDQRRLPGEEISYTFTTYQAVAKAIREMVIRGAPAIGVAAAMGVAIGVQNSSAKSLADLQEEFPLILDTLAKTRPTAVDLFWALDRMQRRFAELSAQSSDLAQIKRALIEEAKAVHLEKRATDEAIGRFGAEFMPHEGRVMTQCNAGALATGSWGYSSRGRAGQKAPRPCAGNASVPTRCAADRLGTAPQQYPAHSHYR